MTQEGLPISPALEPTLQAEKVYHLPPLVDSRVAWITALSMLLGGVAFTVSQILTRLIGLITNLSFYGRFSSDFTSPANNSLGLWVLGVPVIGGIIVGFMARFGSKAIRGHGIPEAMDKFFSTKVEFQPGSLF